MNEKKLPEQYSEDLNDILLAAYSQSLKIMDPEKHFFMLMVGGYDGKDLLKTVIHDDGEVSQLRDLLVRFLDEKLKGRGVLL